MTSTTEDPLDDAASGAESIGKARVRGTGEASTREARTREAGARDAASTPNELVVDQLVVDQLVQFARKKLGPASERFLADPANRVSVFARMRCGHSLDDAALAEIHRAAAADRALADEFVVSIVLDLMRCGRRVHSPAFDRFLDSTDLVQSVFGDVWSRLFKLRFDTRAQFIAFLSTRVKWKAADRRRRVHVRRPAVELAQSDATDIVDPAPSPADAAADIEEAELERHELARALSRLPDVQRQVVALYLDGWSLHAMALRMGCSYDAARVALGRALKAVKDSR